MLLGVWLVGCSVTDNSSNESMDLCGEHTCGDLRMVTSDTSSDGFQYLEPVLSPDGSILLFTADFNALPEPGHGDDEGFNLHRMLIAMPMIEDLPFSDYLNSVRPRDDLASQGAHLILFANRIFFRTGTTTTNIDGDAVTKSTPNWIDDDSILFSMFTGLGNRLVVADFPELVPGTTVAEVTDVRILFQEEDDVAAGGKYWQHMAPSVSPDGQWVAFSRHGCEDNSDASTCTQQALYAFSLVDSTLGLIALTEAVSEVSSASWSLDSSKIVFHAGRDLSGESGYGTEIYTIDFDTTGLAADGAIELNRNLHRVTYSYEVFGNPIDNVRNLDPFFLPGDQTIVFTSTDRAPSLTLRVRNLWQVPVDGSLEPSIFFFSREDDMSSGFAGSCRSVVFSSWMGFPQESLDVLEAKARDRIAAEDSNNVLTTAEEAELAAEERSLLERFTGTSAHLFVFDAD